MAHRSEKCRSRCIGASSTVRCVQLRLPGGQVPELTYFGSGQEWERDHFVFELYVHNLLRIACPDRSGLEHAFAAKYD